MDKTLIVIPYLAQEAQGSELELAVAGWRQHFKDPYQIVLVGDYHPIARADDITFISCPRIQYVKEGQYLPHLDHLHKFLTVLESFPQSIKGFVYACDDMYAVQDFWIEDIVCPKVQHLNVGRFNWQAEGAWLGDLGKTRDFCEEHNWPTHDWVCHLPVYYEVADFLDVVNMVKKDESYIWENLYFNSRLACYHFYTDILKRKAGPLMQLVNEPVLLQGRNKYKYEVLTSYPGIETTDEAGSIWITNGNCGWSARLEGILREHYFFNAVG